jgi:hypothetical protein
MRGRGPGEGPIYRARGGYLDTFAYPSQSGNARRPELAHNGD